LRYPLIMDITLENTWPLHVSLHVDVAIKSPQYIKRPIGMSRPNFKLTQEETFIWECARTWRQPKSDIYFDKLDWQRIAQIAQNNRMETLLFDYLTKLHMWDKVPSDAWKILESGTQKYAQNAAIMIESLQTYLHKAAELKIKTVVLKGLSISVNLYDNPVMRPGGDIDILVRKKDIEACIEILDQMNIGQNWPNLMHDDYYSRHHLHQQRCTPDLKLWYEIHWALDHPLTHLTIDYEEIMNRTTPGILFDAPLHELSWPDNLIALSVHLVKHAVYLTSVLHRSDLARIILADGMLMYFLDIAELINYQGDKMDWQQLVSLCRRYGTVDMVGAALQVCQQLFNISLPDGMLAKFPVKPPGHIKRQIMRLAINDKMIAYQGQSQSRFWRFILVTNGAFILRPIRLLDLFDYLFPGREYLQRKYYSNSLFTAVKHFLWASGQYGRVGIDTLYFIWERYWRLRRLKFNTSLFNRLEVKT